MKDADKSIEQIDAEIEKLANERNELFKRIKPLEDKLVSKYNRIKKLEELKSKKKIADKSFTLEELLHETGHGSDMVRYYECENRLRELGLRTSGYISAIQQKQVQISVAHDASDEDIAKVKAGIETLLPLLKPYDDNHYNLEGVIAFDIMESTLAEYGIWNGRYQPSTGKWFLCKTTYSRPELKGTYESLDEFLVMLKVKHPYPGPSHNYDEDDYDD